MQLICLSAWGFLISNRVRALSSASICCATGLEVVKVTFFHIVKNRKHHLRVDSKHFKLSFSNNVIPLLFVLIIFMI